MPDAGPAGIPGGCSAEILGGNRDGLAAALSRIHADPNPEHLGEARLIIGQSLPVGDLTFLSLVESSFAFYSVEGTAAAVGGVSGNPFSRGQVWYATTADAVERPRWLWRESKRHLERIGRRLGPGSAIWQVIPAEYARGLNFVRHLGFREARRMKSAITGAELVLVEREVPTHDA